MAITRSRSYSYYTGGTAPLDVQNGAASYNFATDSGTGGETFVNGQSLHYTFSNTPSDYQLQSTQTSFLGVVTATESETAVILAGREDISQVFGNGTQITGGQLAYITVATQSESEGIYDGQGRLITGIFETSSLPAITVTISTSDPNYAEEAATLAQEFNVPETDANVVNASTPSQAPDSTTSVDNQGNATTDSTNSATAGTASADPGFQAEVVQANGNTLRWSFNVDGTIASRDIIDTSGNSTSEDFDSNGNYIGTSTSTANPDGSVVTQTYDAQGNSTGSRTTVEYGAGTTLTINGVTTSYSNGCTVASQYGPAGGGGQMLEFTVSSEVENVDGTYTTTEVNYQPIFNSEYVPESGRILIDGIDLQQADPMWLRRQVGVVLQENFLFNGSIRDNIAIHMPGAPMAQIVEMARLAGAHEFILELPEAYDTPVGERGTALSGGQRQRIAIARALMANPRILIFDEATSALDYESERIIQDNLGRICKGRTVFIVAHRLSTIRQADTILVLDKGQLAEQGTHNELMTRPGIYHHLFSQQLGGVAHAVA